MNTTTKPRFSIVIPTYNAEKFIERAVASLTRQTFGHFEVVVVDDASSDSTVEIVKRLAEEDQRVRYFVQSRNSGTLAARAKGVAEAKGSYILLMDQDDELTSETLQNLSTYGNHDIAHFGVKVVPESEGAKQAANGCEGWLNPRPRMLMGSEVLQKQFCDEGNFDWHVHHKVFKAQLAKEAWGKVEQERLCTADDFLVSYILCSLAKNYVAIPNSQWYVYHLGAGETFGGDYTLEHWKRICDADAKAFKLIGEFDKNNDGNHQQILQNCQDKLIEHVMNEMHDNLCGRDVNKCIDYALKSWSADAVAGELWRFVRDRACCDLASNISYKNDSTLKTLVKQAEHAEGSVRELSSERHSQMKEVANARLRELKGSDQSVMRVPIFSRIRKLLRKG